MYQEILQKYINQINKAKNKVEKLDLEISFFLELEKEKIRTFNQRKYLNNLNPAFIMQYIKKGGVKIKKVIKQQKITKQTKTGEKVYVYTQPEFIIIKE